MIISPAGGPSGQQVSGDLGPELMRGAPVLRRLTGLRAFAALAVFAFHLESWQVAALPMNLSTLGSTGVAFFFVLSGFVLAWGTDPQLPMTTFYRRRFARVYPLDFATLIIACLVPVVAVNRSWTAGVANAFMLQAWFRDDAIVYGMNGVSWSLSCEAFFYATFPLAAIVVRRVPRSASWTIASVGLTLAAVAFLLRPGLAVHMPPIRMAEFFLGVAAGVAYRDGWRPHIRGIAVVAVLLASLAISSAVIAPLRNAIMAGPFLLLILYAAARDLNGRPGWLGSPALVLAGEVSYAFYLVHELVIVNLSRALPAGLPTVVLLLAVAASCAFALHVFIERPCNRWLRDPSPSLALSPVVDANWDVAVPEVHSIDREMLDRARSMAVDGTPIDEICRAIEPGYDQWTAPQRQAYQNVMRGALEHGG